ncbi:Protein TRANSPARENT TESTA 12 -like protein [Gossypium arboreum]|uniref:Protein TRANSPARENT TESTA 12-like protein n=1 Tax=Gossypium arboreum TaxID=29729 RepID=A0A0B0MP69_GOSAR|nr:Protein TRANSPARENT TESTA 12 -like protein [Gossypium arboreum]
MDDTHRNSDEYHQPLLTEPSSNDEATILRDEDGEEGKDLSTRLWIETKKLWVIVGPSIISRVAGYSMNIITQAFAGHLGDVELAAISIANTVIVGFNFGFLLGMASALETLCGQAFGAKQYHMLGIYMQRSWIVLLLCCFLLLPFYVFATPVLKLLGQPDDVAEMSGVAAIWMIPLHFNFAFQFPLQRFLQSQSKTLVLAYASFGALGVNVLTSWVFVNVLDWGVIGASLALDISWWVGSLGLYSYTVLGGCPFMSINGWELMIPLAFLAATGVRVANELGAGNWKGAKFATKVSIVQSTIVGVFFCIIVLVLRDKVALIFTSSNDVLEEVDKLSYLLGVTILLNSVQPVLSGVAIGSGWQATVAYINLGCYYIIGLPLGILMGWVFKLGVSGIWGGMIFGGTAIQTVILAIFTIRRDWKKEAEKAKQRVRRWAK